MREAVRLFLCGLGIGVANVIPGVSGGTVAVLVGVYDRLVEVITPSVRKILAAWRFWVPLAAGVLTGLLLFSKLMTPVFALFPAPASWFFMGLIAASLPFLYWQKACFFNRTSWVCCFIALCVMVLPVVTGFSSERTLALAPASLGPVTAALFASLFAGGAVAAFAMVIPGISGSFILLVLGLYRPVVAAVAELRASVLLPLGLGVVLGIFAGARLMHSLLRRYGGQTYGAILGLVAGSLAVMYPQGLGLGPGKQWAASLVCFALGIALTSILGGHKKSP